jgi:hypothetical protein
VGLIILSTVSAALLCDYLVLMWLCISDFVDALLPTVSPSKLAASHVFFFNHRFGSLE